MTVWQTVTREQKTIHAFLCTARLPNKPRILKMAKAAAVMANGLSFIVGFCVIRPNIVSVAILDAIIPVDQHKNKKLLGPPGNSSQVVCELIKVRKDRRGTV